MGLEAAHYIHFCFLFSQLMSHSQGAFINSSACIVVIKRDQLHDHVILEARNYNKGGYLLVSHRNTFGIERQITVVTPIFLLCTRPCEWLFTYKDLLLDVHNSPVKWVPLSLLEGKDTEAQPLAQGPMECPYQGPASGPGYWTPHWCLASLFTTMV